MSVLAFLDRWWNLPFLVMLGLVAVFFVLQLAGLVGDAADEDLDADADADLDGDADAEGDADADGAWHAALGFLGVGRVPFMVIWVTLFLFWGFGGLIANRLVLDVAPRYPGWFFPISVVGSLLVALGAVRVASRLAARFIDVGGDGATARRALCGREGVVASARLDSRFGEIRVRDDHGEEHLVHARLAAGEPVLRRGASVVLIDWEESAALYSVTPFADSDSRRTAALPGRAAREP